METRRALIPMSPSHTPRSSDKMARENGNGNGKSDKEKGVNIQVVLRCRPLSEEEKKLSTPGVITCSEPRREVSVTQKTANKHNDRTFTFDKVFGPKSRQKDVFDHAVVPLVNEVLEGYNCTIFAYGQTGTGKTYTMEGGFGGKNLENEELPTEAGVIPRAVKKIFQVLEAQGTEYSMKVSFLELYNEELMDLLAPEDLTPKYVDEKTKKPLALMEDGKGGVFVRGLEEEIVCSAGEIYKILEKGSAKRKTAETLLNKQSSRSHSIFSITIHIKESTPEGEELIKCGKLNLVDLAGSENVSRSGARDGRAREAGEINKSLLTLGRVINTLVEHSGHIPYRDSKLTRLLRDSLGGKTRTCIIATISPAVYCLEETLSTLDYAHRAKNIKNKPEVNQKMMKTALIKDLYTDIDRLKQELYAAREKNGIYIPKEQYLLDEAEKKAMTEKIDRMEIDIESKDKQLTEVKDLYDKEKTLSEDLTNNLQNTQTKLDQTEHSLSDLEQRHKQAVATIKEKEFLIYQLLKSEKALFDQATDLRLDLENAQNDISGLFSKIEKKDKLENSNKTLVEKFRLELSQDLGLLHKTVSSSVDQQESQLKELETEMKSFLSVKTQVAEKMKERMESLKESCCKSIKELDGLTGQIDSKSQLSFENLNSQVKSHSSSLEDSFKTILSEADQLIGELTGNLSKQEDNLSTFMENQHARILSSVEATRSISNVTNSFFEALNAQNSKLSLLLEDSQTLNNEKLLQLEKKFEDCAAKEEKDLLEKVAELLADSNTRKKQLVQEAIEDLKETASNKTSQLNTEIDTTQNETDLIREKWGAYMQKAENSYSDDKTAIDDGKLNLSLGLQQCVNNVKSCSEQWRNAQTSVLNIALNHVSNTDSIIRDGIETNKELRTKISTLVSTGINDFDIANKELQFSINDSLRLDGELNERTAQTLILPCSEKLKDLQNEHQQNVTKIEDYAERDLQKEYLVDEPSCNTPTKKEINVPSLRFIEELKSPSFDELLKAFWEQKVLSKDSSGDVKILIGAIEGARQPFSTIN
ncbi:hypothetical protein LUZ60_015336 [Juncus effusus]|nr:hypothetical protein LUZ60_015336 [Juncus effusus]